MVEKIYVVEIYDCGIEKAFWTIEAARQYVLKDYLDYVKLNKDSTNVENVASNIEQLFDRDCIDDWAYIYSVEVEG